MKEFIVKNVDWLGNCARCNLPTIICEGEIIKLVQELEEVQRLDELNRLRVLFKMGRGMLDEPFGMDVLAHLERIFYEKGMDEKLIRCMICTGKVGAGTVKKLIENYDFHYEKRDGVIKRAILTIHY